MKTHLGHVHGKANHHDEQHQGNRSLCQQDHDADKELHNGLLIHIEIQVAKDVDRVVHDLLHGIAAQHLQHKEACQHDKSRIDFLAPAHLALLQGVRPALGRRLLGLFTGKKLQVKGKIHFASPCHLPARIFFIVML